MAITAGAPFAVFVSLQENGASHRSYPNQALLRNKLLKNKSKLIGRHQCTERFCSRLLMIKASTRHDLVVEQSAKDAENGIGVTSIHHVGILCSNLERSLEFYQGLLGLEVNDARPNDKLPYRGKWLWVGSEMIHLMELPNPDPVDGRPEHGGRDRHTCIAIKDVNVLKSILDKAGLLYTLSRSGRPAIFTRDPDGNALEFVQID